jgi:methylated-DNA-[protein]-cysteine S-methyltransferase
MKTDLAVESIYAKSIGCYIVVKRRGNEISCIAFSRERQGPASYVTEGILGYLSGETDFFYFKLDLARLSAFQKEAFKVVLKIPRGELMTYGAVANRIHRPDAARAVGRALACNPFPVVIPCHRVVAKNGLGGYSGGVELKEKLLALERQAEGIQKSTGT